jgi:hypothetical protein
VQAFSVPFCLPQVVLKLLIEPALGTGIERNGEPDGHFRADARATIKYTGKRFAAYSQRSRSLGDGQIQRFQAQSLKNLTRVRRIMHFHI